MLIINYIKKYYNNNAYGINVLILILAFYKYCHTCHIVYYSP